MIQLKRTNQRVSQIDKWTATVVVDVVLNIRRKLRVMQTLRFAKRKIARIVFRPSRLITVELYSEEIDFVG